MDTTLLLRSLSVIALCCALVTGRGQTLLQSGFEQWTDGLPNGFAGTHTDLALDSISEESDLVHGGLRAMRMGLRAGQNGSITTLPLAVTADLLYEVRFWVMGSGRIGTSVHDGRPENDGWGPTSAAVEVNGTEWQFVIQTVFVTNTTSNAEFAFHLEGLADTSYLIIDDLRINVSNVAVAQSATIAEIQETSSFTGASPLNFVIIRTEGVITALAPSSFFIQDGSGPWRGIQVRYPPAPSWAIGDVIKVIGAVSELNGETETWTQTRTQIISVNHLERISTGAQVPEPVPVNAADLQQEQWESVLVRVPDLICMNAPDPLWNDWPAAQDGSTVHVDDLLHYYFPTIGATYAITGIAHYAGSTVLLPRSDADIELQVVGIPEARSLFGGLYPVPASDHFTVELRTVLTSGTYSLLDPTGRILETGAIRGTIHRIDVHHRAPGTYLLRITDGQQHETARVLIQR